VTPVTHSWEGAVVVSVSEIGLYTYQLDAPQVKSSSKAARRTVKPEFPTAERGEALVGDGRASGSVERCTDLQNLSDIQGFRSLSGSRAALGMKRNTGQMMLGCFFFLM
jgi:hypothetical protein